MCGYGKHQNSTEMGSWAAAFRLSSLCHLVHQHQYPYASDGNARSKNGLMLHGQNTMSCVHAQLSRKCHQKVRQARRRQPHSNIPKEICDRDLVMDTVSRPPPPC